MGLPEANGTGLTVTSVGNIDSQTTRAIFTLCRVSLCLFSNSFGAPTIQCHRRSALVGLYSAKVRLSNPRR